MRSKQDCQAAIRSNLLAARDTTDATQRDHRIGESRRVPGAAAVTGAVALVMASRACSLPLLLLPTCPFVAQGHDRYISSARKFSPYRPLIVPQYFPYCSFRTSSEQTGKRMLDQAAIIRGRKAWNLGGIWEHWYNSLWDCWSLSVHQGWIRRVQNAWKFNAPPSSTATTITTNVNHVPPFVTKPVATIRRKYATASVKVRNFENRGSWFFTSARVKGNFRGPNLLDYPVL